MAPSASLMNRPLLRCLLVVVASGLVSCATSARVTTLEGRIHKLERERAGLVADLERERQRLRRLHDEIERSTGHMRHSGARVTTTIDQLTRQLKEVRGEIEVFAHRIATMSGLSSRYGSDIDVLKRRIDRLIADLRDRAGIAILALPRELPEKADDWVTLAQLRFDQGEVRVAEAIARECAKRFAATVPAGRCGLIRARVYFEEHRFDDAVTTLQSVHDALGGKPLPVVADALLAIGEVLEAEGKCGDAMNVLDYLHRDLSKLPQARKAKARRKLVKQRCKAGVRRLPAKTSGKLKPAPAAVAAPAGASPTAAP